MNNLNSQQKDELIAQYVDLLVDGMSTKDLVAYVTDSMITYAEGLSNVELKEEIDNHDEELYDELVNNVTTQTTEVN